MDAATVKQRIRRRDTGDNRAERKRELDRLAQRATRERTKNRIAYLEQKLASLESCDRQGEISNLTKIIDTLRNDNMRLQSAMLKMRFAINEALDDAEGFSTQQQNPQRSCGCLSSAKCSCQTNGASTSPEEDEHERHASISTLDSEVIDMPPEIVHQVQPDPANIPPMEPVDPVSNGMTSEIASLEDFFGFNGAVSIPVMNTIYDMPQPDFMQWQNPMPSPFDYRMPVPTNALTVARDIDKWNVSDVAFIGCMEAAKHKHGSNANLDLHVPFKAAIWGWDTVGEDANHPVWAALRRVDQQVFGTWTNKAQRIALMYVCQTLLQYRENPTKENLERVPRWFRPRPAQEKVQHPAVIDFLIWPGMRDRLVFEHEKYTRTGDFSAAFVNNFNFNWPYTEKEIYNFNPLNQRYEVSKVFLEYAYDFRNWTMKAEFFRKFPEMQHDVPAYNFNGGMPELNHGIWT